MTFKEARDVFLNRGYVEVEGGQIFDGDKWRQCIVVISEWLKQESCTDAISRQAVIDMTGLSEWFDSSDNYNEFVIALSELPPITPQPKIGHCKECKYFEYNSMAKVDGIPLIVAHEICNKWGNGCKTNENGYCFLFEPQERSKE